MACNKDIKYPVKVVTPKYMGCDVPVFSADAIMFKQSVPDLGIMENDTLDVAMGKIGELIKTMRQDILTLKQQVDELT